MSKSRNKYLDFVKGVLIFLVVYEHSIQFFVYKFGYAFWEDPFLKFILIFHMPLFIGISGYFTFFSIQKSSQINFLKNRLKYLFVPMLLWCVINFIFNSLVTREVSLHSFLGFFEMSYWFIWALLFYFIILSLLSVLKINKVPILLISLVAVTLLPFERYQFGLIKSMYPYFIFGYLLAGVDLTKAITLLKNTSSYYSFYLLHVSCSGLRVCILT